VEPVGEVEPEGDHDDHHEEDVARHLCLLLSGS
jgi:hypothetical protein